MPCLTWHFSIYAHCIPYCLAGQSFFNVPCSFLSFSNPHTFPPVFPFPCKSNTPYPYDRKLHFHTNDEMPFPSAIYKPILADLNKKIQKVLSKSNLQYNKFI